MSENANMRQIHRLQPDFFGLIFYPKSPRFVSLAQAKALPHFENIKRVGVFVNETVDNIVKIAEQTDLALIQLHGGESPAVCRALNRANLQIVKAFSVDEHFDQALLQQYEEVCDYFLFDTKTSNYGGSGQNFDWQILQSSEINRPFFLSGGIGAENAAGAVRACQDLPLYALDINSRAEIRAGIKSAKIVYEIIKSL